MDEYFLLFCQPDNPLYFPKNMQYNEKKFYIQEL